MIKVILADDHRMLLEGIKIILGKDPEIRLVAEAIDGIEVMQALENTSVDVAILDIKMKRMGGLEVTDLMRERFPHVKVLILTTYAEKEYVNRAVELGAAGYILKERSAEDLVKGIKGVHAGHRVFSQEIIDLIVGNANVIVRTPSEAMAAVPDLTSREIEVLKLLCDDYDTKGIANKLGIKTSTVKTYRKSLLSKLPVKTSYGLTSYALRHKLV